MGSNPARPTTLRFFFVERRIIISSTITFGYSDTEDRLWVRILNDDGSDKKMWLTRNLCGKICSCLASNLEKTTSIDKEKSKVSAEIFDQLASEHQIAVNKMIKATVSSRSEESIKSKSPGPIRLCNSVNISFGKDWTIKFFCTEEENSFQIKTDRQNVHQILSALIKKCEQAGWNIQKLPIWRKH